MPLTRTRLLRYTVSRVRYIPQALLASFRSSCVAQRRREKQRNIMSYVGCMEYVSYVRCMEYVSFVRCMEYMSYVRCMKYVNYVRCMKCMSHVRCMKYVSYVCYLSEVRRWMEKIGV